MFSTILVPIDVNHKDWTTNALRHVDGLNDPNIRIVLLHVAYEPPGHITAGLPPELLRENREKLVAELDEFAKKAGKNVIVEIRQGNRPSSIILHEAERLGADLIVIGSHQPGLSDYLMGSTASRVVRHAKCPVLVSR